MSEPKEPLDPTLPSPRSTPAAQGPLPALDESRYRVEAGADGLLGRGGQGAVWRARDEVLRREVALKRLHGKGRDGEETAFLREARLTSLLEHPGIVPVHDLGRAADGAATLVMRRIDGRSLAEHLDSLTSLDDRLALVPALLRACQTVAFAHERHVVHRDLKPQNIMLGSFGETYVLDWGVAIVAQPGAAIDVTAPAENAGVVGSPAYMSPEQALGLPADERSDVFGLGACLYHLLTGAPPLSGASLHSALGHAAAGDIVPVKTREPRVPRDLAAICDKALQPERANRYASALELARDLDAWLVGRRVSARRYSPGEQLLRFVKRYRIPFVVLTIALGVLVSSLVVEELRVRRERDDARSFARELLVDVPQQVATQRPSVELLELLTSRAESWLSRRDFDVEDRIAACGLLTQLSALNADGQRPAEARRLSNRALELARASSALQRDPHFVACEGSALIMLGRLALLDEHREEGLQLYAQAETALDAWQGPPSPVVVLAQATLQRDLGDDLWEREPAKGAEHHLEAAKLVLPFLADGDRAFRNSALGSAANGALALWGLGRRSEARALAGQIYAGAKPSCDAQDNGSQRACLAALTSYLTLLSWDDEAQFAALLPRALELDAHYLEHNADSAPALYDATLFAIERGDLDAAAHHLERLRALAPPLAGEFGPLVSSLRGQLDAVEGWDVPEGDQAAALAEILVQVAHGEYAPASAGLRALDHQRLWYALSWPAHPKLSLEVPAAARPSLDAFVRDFTKAYGDADHAALARALDGFADALDALQGARP
ncbi:MAG: serine/threonine-protein kinase [Myxococcaceae bacterium]